MALTGAAAGNAKWNGKAESDRISDEPSYHRKPEKLQQAGDAATPHASMHS